MPDGQICFSASIIKKGGARRYPPGCFVLHDRVPRGRFLSAADPHNNLVLFQRGKL